MTNFNAALTTPDYNLLRRGEGANRYAGDYLITLCANRVVFAGQVNSDLTTPSSWAQFNYNNVTVGSYPDVEVDQVLLISTTNDKTKAEFRGRIRLPAAANAIFCSESSQDFVAGAYFWVLDTYDPQYKLSRPDNNSVEFIDYAVGYAGPEPIVLGLRLAYVDNVDSSTGKMRVAFNVSSSYATVPSGTISSYQFTFKASSYTVISGSLSSSAVTVDFNPGEQWGKLVITDSSGTTKTRRFYIKAIDASYPPDLGFDNCTITGDLTRGFVLSVPAFAGVDTMLRDTFCVVWRANELYGGIAGQLYPTNNIAFTGWFQREDDDAHADQTASIVEEAKFEFTGIGPRMARLTAQLLALRISASPAVWGELANLTPWRAICHFLSRYTTLANLCDIDFSDKSDTFLFPTISTQGGNVFNAVGGIANQINALLETAPDGRIQFNRNAEYLTTAQRSTLTTVANFTTQDVISATRTQEQNRNVGKVDGDGATYNSVTGQVTVFTSRAPGIAQGEAGGSSTLSGQILAYNSNPDNVRIELRQRTGNKYEIDNNSEILSTEHPDGYAPLFIPSKGQLFTFTLSALTASGMDRIDYTTSDYWTLESTTITRQGNGATGVRCQWRKLNRVGDPGDDTTLPPVVVADDPTPDLGVEAFAFEDTDVTFPEAGLELNQVNPAQLAPPPGTVLATNGQTVIASNGTNAWLLKNFITLKKPIAVDVTPSDLGSFAIKQVLFDPFGTRTAQGAYILASDGTSSAVWYTSNVAAPIPTWTKGAVLSGVYTVIRATQTAGAILIYTPGEAAGTFTYIYDFTTSNNGWTTQSVAVGTPGSYSAGVGWVHGDFQQPANNYYRGVYIGKAFSNLTVTQIDVLYDLSGLSTNLGAGNDCAEIIVDSGNVANITFGAQTNGTNKTFTWTPGAPTSISLLKVIIDSSYYGTATYTGSVTIKRITITGQAASARVAYSSDSGATFASPTTVGDRPGSVGGMDTQLAGTVSFAAATSAVKKASTLGGAYSAFINTTGANPVCCVVPWFTRNSTTVKNTTGSTPDVLVALDAADSDGGSLYWVSGAGTKTNITPTAGMTFDSANCVTLYYGKYLMAFGKVAGVYKMYKSTDGGTSWTFIKNLTTPHFIRGRRKDSSILRGKGQLYVTNGNSIDYSGYFGANGTFPRTLPASGVLTFDILG